MKLLARIVVCLNDRTIRVQIPNGHMMMGIVPRRSENSNFLARIGCVVLLSISPIDMSKGVVALDS